MTRLLISTALIGILSFASAAYAQGDDHRRDDRGGRGQAPAAAAPAAAAPAARPAPAAPPASASQQTSGRNGRGFNGRGFTPPPAPVAQAAPAAQPAARGFDNRNAGNRGPDNRGAAPNNAMRGFDNRGQANRGPGPNNNTAMRGQNNFSSYHRNFSAPRRYHATVYNRPRGWYSHRWTFGEILPALFWAPNYWLDDYMNYGLEPPPPGTLWVRDGGDALLIVRGTGEILQVEYSVFY